MRRSTRSRTRSAWTVRCTDTFGIPSTPLSLEMYFGIDLKGAHGWISDATTASFLMMSVGMGFRYKASSRHSRLAPTLRR